MTTRVHMVGETITGGEKEPQTLEQQAMLAIDRPDVLDMPVPNFPGFTGRNFLDGYPTGSTHRDDTERKLRVLVAMTPESEGYDLLRNHVTEYVESIFGKKPV